MFNYNSILTGHQSGSYRAVLIFNFDPTTTATRHGRHTVIAQISWRYGSRNRLSEYIFTHSIARGHNCNRAEALDAEGHACIEFSKHLEPRLPTSTSRDSMKNCAQHRSLFVQPPSAWKVLFSSAFSRSTLSLNLTSSNLSYSGYNHL